MSLSFCKLSAQLPVHSSVGTSLLVFISSAFANKTSGALYLSLNPIFAVDCVRTLSFTFISPIPVFSINEVGIKSITLNETIVSSFFTFASASLCNTPISIW